MSRAVAATLSQPKSGDVPVMSQVFAVIEMHCASVLDGWESPVNTSALHRCSRWSDATARWSARLAGRRQRMQCLVSVRNGRSSGPMRFSSGLNGAPWTGGNVLKESR
jgi:hypothetical protein